LAAVLAYRRSCEGHLARGEPHARELYFAAITERFERGDVAVALPNRIGERDRVILVRGNTNLCIVSAVLRLLLTLNPEEKRAGRPRA
jgi:hypothetical protein